MMKFQTMSSENKRLKNSANSSSNNHHRRTEVENLAVFARSALTSWICRIFEVTRQTTRWFITALGADKVMSLNDRCSTDIAHYPLPLPNGPRLERTHGFSCGLALCKSRAVSVADGNSLCARNANGTTGSIGTETTTDAFRDRKRPGVCVRNLIATSDTFCH